MGSRILSPSYWRCFDRLPRNLWVCVTPVSLGHPSPSSHFASLTLPTCQIIHSCMCTHTTHFLKSHGHVWQVLTKQTSSMPYSICHVLVLPSLTSTSEASAWCQCLPTTFDTSRCSGDAAAISQPWRQAACLCSIPHDIGHLSTL